ncbi:MAG: hypothetical protein ACRCXA_04860 [Peptostreptococcaceae bacterium]
MNSKVKSNLQNSFSTVYNKSKPEFKSDIDQNTVGNSSDSSQISKEISDILSNENSYDVAIKCDDIRALVSIDSITNDSNITKLSNDDSFDAVSSKSDKYISLNNYSIDDLEGLKDRIGTASLSEKYEIVKDILKNSDTNLKESDLISIAFKYITQK